MNCIKYHHFLRLHKRQTKTESKQFLHYSHPIFIVIIIDVSLHVIDQRCDHEFGLQVVVGKPGLDAHNGSAWSNHAAFPPHVDRCEDVVS